MNKKEKTKKEKTKKEIAISKKELYAFVKKCTEQQIIKYKELDNLKKAKEKLKKYLKENTRFTIDDK